MSNFTREYVADLEIRADGSGRTIHGIVVPYGVTARVSDGGRPYDEKFAPGAFARSLSHTVGKVRLLAQHNSTRPIGVATEMREDASGLYGAFKVSNVTDGNEHLELVRDGVLGAFSVGFTPVKHISEGGVTVRTEAKLREVSLVTFPAYEGALVSGVRSADDIATDIESMDPEQRAELLRLLANATPLGDPANDSTPDPGPAVRHYTPDELRTMIRARIALRSAA